jgi:hypothetical protein
VHSLLIDQKREGKGREGQKLTSRFIIQMMHQDHNIPLHIFPTHFKFDLDAPTRKNELVPRRLPTQTRDLNYFVKKLIDTIDEFAQTERGKYPEKMPLQTGGKIYPDELIDQYPEYLNKKNQQLESWFREGNFTTDHGDLADVVKIFIIENELQALPMLAQHPKVPFLSLCFLSWRHMFGFSHASDVLRPYVYFNVVDKMGLLCSGEYKKTHSFKELKNEITMTIDYDAQQVPHRAFVKEHKDEHAEPWDDYEKVLEYLKKLFAILYRYRDVVWECKGDPGRGWCVKEDCEWEIMRCSMVKIGFDPEQGGHFAEPKPERLRGRKKWNHI